MKKFLYVYTEEARDVLLKANFKLLKTDSRAGIYIFENQSEQNSTQQFALNNISYIPSDVLTF